MGYIVAPMDTALPMDTPPINVIKWIWDHWLNLQIPYN